MVKEFWKSVNIWQSYGKNVLFFTHEVVDHHATITTGYTDADHTVSTPNFGCN